MTFLRRLAPLAPLAALLTLTACASTPAAGTAPAGPVAAPDLGSVEVVAADSGLDAELAAAILPAEAGANGIELPAGIEAPTLGGTGAAWAEQEGYLYVMTFGSSTCPGIAEGAAALEGGNVVVTFQEVEENKPCTMDLRAWTTVVKAPRSEERRVGKECPV